MAKSFKWYVVLWATFLYQGICGLLKTIAAFVAGRPKSIAGQVVVITGGASGIGKEVARMLANLGAKLVLLDANEKMNEETANEINEDAGIAVPFTVDVTDPDQLCRVAVKIQNHPELGDPDIVICNAGVFLPKPFLTQKDADIKRTININILGYFWTVRAFLPRMLERDQGQLVILSSVAGHYGNAHMADYSASKFAVRGLMESLQWELYDLKSNITLTTVYPYFTRTPMLDNRRVSSNIYHVLSVEETATTVVKAIIYNEFETFTSCWISFFCNTMKALAPWRMKIAYRNLINIHCESA